MNLNLLTSNLHRVRSLTSLITQIQWECSVQVKVHSKSNRLGTVFNKWNGMQYIVNASIYFKTFWNVDTMTINWDIHKLFSLCIRNLSIYCACSLYLSIFFSYVWLDNYWALSTILIDIMNTIILNLYNGL